MRAKGINYDTGVTPGGKQSRPVFDLAQVRRELRTIAEDLHCTAIRISGADPERIGAAAAIAAELGLEIWFAPFPCDLTPDEMLPIFADCAERAEALRLAGAEVILVLGCEISLFAKGFLPGDDTYTRIERIMAGDAETFAAFASVPAEVTAFLNTAATAARARFGGRITYASGLWEDIDWRPFDIVSVDAYRDKENAATFRDQLAERVKIGKPVAVTEFGCCTYTGAGDRGGMGWAIVDDKADPPTISGDHARDEQEQVRYLRELLAIFEEIGVDTALWFTFASFNAPYSPDPRHDLDLAAYGVVKVTDEGLVPKAVFGALAEAYSSSTKD
jgi:sugar phosphate isomerase/epimerase